MTKRPATFDFDRRASGLLLHPTSLPGPYGSGDLGPEAYRFVDFLAAAGQRWWQMLPVGPPGEGHSPYSAASAFAGNPQLISPELLAREGWLRRIELLPPRPRLNPRRVDFHRAGEHRGHLLQNAWSRWFHGRGYEKKHFRTFVSDNAFWLDDFALFRALKIVHNGTAWPEWPSPLRNREPRAMAHAKRDFAIEILREQFWQFAFDRQWQLLRERCAKDGVGLIGDIPIFVAYDSAEVWAKPHLFKLDRDLRPKVVSGCPPDFFNADGQRWGHPHYDWPVHAKEGYRWWIERFRQTLRWFDAVRIDHFLGFHRVWSIPANSLTAKRGRYTPGPGEAFFRALERTLGDVPIIAEDLGSVVPEVFALRDRFNFPGMRVLQFGFGDGGEYHLPHNYTRRSVAYTGTHDNDTTAGWLRSIPAKERRRVIEYTGCGASKGANASASRNERLTWQLIRAVQASTADTAVIPVQDLLSSPSRDRMNTPGTATGNWSWRLKPGELTSEVGRKLRKMVEVYERL